jgi:PmbA protein
MGDPQEVAVQAVQWALDAGASDVFVSYDRTREVESQVRDGRLETVKDATSQDLGFKIWADGRFGAHSTNDLRPEAVRAFLREAIALTRAVQPDPHRVVPDARLFGERSTIDLDLYDREVAALTREGRLAMAIAANDEIRERARVVSATTWVADRVHLGAVASSNGLRGSDPGTSLWVGAEVTLDEDGKRPEEAFAAGARHLAEVPEPREVARRAWERATARLGSQKGPTQKARMVVDPQAGPNLLARLLGPATASALSSQQSFWNGQEGRKVLSSALTVIDDPLVPRGLGSRLYDNEGIVAKRRVILEQGALVDLYVDTYYGHKLARPANGGTPSNRIVQSGSRDLAAILRDTTSGIYVSGWLGGNSDATSGDYSLGLRGFLIQGGELVGPVSEMNITGDLLGLFARLIEVGNDPWPYSMLHTPTLVFDAVDFSGA